MKQMRDSLPLGTVLIFAIFVCMISGCGGDVGEELVDVTKPSPYVAETPEQALELFFEGIFEGNLAKAKSGIVAGDGVVAYLEANISINRAMDDFAKADRKHFGDDEKAFPVGALAGKTRAELARVRVVKVDDSHANWPLKPDNPMKILKTDSGWKVDMSGDKSKSFMKLSTTSFGEMAAIYDSMTRDIENGELDSRDAVRETLRKLLN